MYNINPLVSKYFIRLKNVCIDIKKLDWAMIYELKENEKGLAVPIYY